ncbi:hypothetical protein BA190_09430 [Labrys sp. WJW]|uniref:hypothetical protein n=1 Tax=Labrys sp. WJW TaxID=1737983 RepID=UPI00083550AB|nr:hypothetical protein [Labrys sp. WJW]OCC05127.1 hypothetical protein BA190_09430 [Labrys sp. WJW]
MPGLNSSQFAKLVGVSPTAIHKAVKSGRVIVGADGLIDPDTQVDRWNSTRDLSKVRGRGRPPTVATPRRSKKAAQDFDDLKVEEKSLQIALLEEELKKRRGETVHKADVELALANFSRLIRDKWLNFANRYGQEIAGDVGADAKAVMASLDRCVRDQLIEISNTRPTVPGIPNPSAST